MRCWARRVLLFGLSVLPALVVACGNDAEGPFYGACQEVMAIDGTTSCWEAHARTLTQLQDLRTALCDVPQSQLLPIGSRCVRDGVVGGCRAAFGVADDPTVMTQGIKWYYATATTQTEADVRNECVAGDGMWLLPDGLFVPPDGDFPPLE
jgi:hypothetical protein